MRNSGECAYRVWFKGLSVRHQLSLSDKPGMEKVLTIDDLNYRPKPKPRCSRKLIHEHCQRPFKGVTVQRGIQEYVGVIEGDWKMQWKLLFPPLGGKG